MIFSRNCRLKSKQAVLLLSCLGFLSMIFLPGASFALPVVTSNGSVSINWAGATLNRFNELNWIDNSDPADPVDTRNSFSSAGVELTGKTGTETANFFEGGFVKTSAAASLSNLLGNATGKADTGFPTTSPKVPVDPASPANRLFASANTSVNLFSKLFGAIAEVTVAEAAFTGQFTVGTSILDFYISVPYHIEQSLNSITPLGLATSDIAAGIYLSNFDTGELYASTEASSIKSIKGFGCYTLPANQRDGFLILDWDLEPNILYDFELSASVKGWADPPAETSVPEPASMLLLGAGLLGIGFFSRKLKKDR
jgi:hypothetical protein